MFVILTGPPAVRKSTAFRIMTKLLRKHTNVRFAPDDTGGQRQGLIAAMMNCKDEGDEKDAAIIERMAQVSAGRAGENPTYTLADLSAAVDDLGTIRFDTRDPRTMFVAASELNSILGENNTALLTFLQKMWDGDPYKYQLKNTEHEIKEALLGLIGATTPSQLAIAMPPEAVGQGFTSRAIFVFADKKHTRKIARPTLDKGAEDELGSIFEKVSNEINGPFSESKDAAKQLDELYVRGITITDPRFVHYADRRHTHLQKLCIGLAASRGSQIITCQDVTFADHLLLYTEQFMHEALGEYGMNKLSAAKQRLVEYLRQSDGPIPTTALYGFVSRDMTQLDFKHAIVELYNAGKVSQVQIDHIGPCIIAISEEKVKSAKGQLHNITEMMAVRA